MSPGPCRRPGCTGTLDSDGYCDTCGMSADTSDDPTGPAPDPAGEPTTADVRWIGDGLVEVPRGVLPDPRGAVRDLAVPETERVCGTCANPVGRGRDGRPGLTRGYCPYCREPFSFGPPLQPEEVVSSQYEVLGCMARGGLGWVYLARDGMVSDRLVVLKGVIDSLDREAVRAAINERDFLAGVNHPRVVKIHNFVEHVDQAGQRGGYIVMEYVRGLTLRDVLRERSVAAGRYDPLPLAHALGYVWEILPAFTHLHELGLVYCDFKPDNVVVSRDQLVLIDLGAVCRAADPPSSVYGTPGYQAPEIERGELPSVSSDLYTIGRALAVMAFEFEGFTTEHRYGLPPAEWVPVLAENESFRRLLARATATSPADRFGSAAEMADQVLGVLRETQARGGEPHPGRSDLFTGERRAGAAPGSAEAGPDWRELPDPLVDPSDRARAYLDRITVADPTELLTLLAAASDRTVEVELAALRAELRAGDLTAARTRLRSIPVGHQRNWRRDWFSGVLDLAEGRAERAAATFDDLYGWLPGELAVKLALAVSHELAGHPDRAAELYDTVSRTDPSYTTACTGLARCRLATGDRAGALRAYQRVPATSAAYRPARIDAIRALLRPDPAPTPRDLREANTMITALGRADAEAARLRAELLTAVLAAVTAGERPDPTDLGVPDASEFGIRRALEGAYRALAERATGTERIDLVDRANAVRPWTRV